MKYSKKNNALIWGGSILLTIIILYILNRFLGNENFANKDNTKIYKDKDGKITFVDKCPPDKPYHDKHLNECFDNKCLKNSGKIAKNFLCECPTDKHWDVKINACVCNSDKPKLIVSCNNDNTGICVKDCPNSLLKYNDKCLSECPNEAPLTDLNALTCSNNCPKDKPNWRKSSDNNNGICYASCPDDHSVFYYGELRDTDRIVRISDDDSGKKCINCARYDGNRPVFDKNINTSGDVHCRAIESLKDCQQLHPTENGVYYKKGGYCFNSKGDVLFPKVD